MFDDICIRINPNFSIFVNIKRSTHWPWQTTFLCYQGMGCFIVHKQMLWRFSFLQSFVIHALQQNVMQDQVTVFLLARNTWIHTTIWYCVQCSLVFLHLWFGEKTFTCSQSPWYICRCSRLSRVPFIDTMIKEQFCSFYCFTSKTLWCPSSFAQWTC